MPLLQRSDSPRRLAHGLRLGGLIVTGLACLLAFSYFGYFAYVYHQLPAQEALPNAAQAPGPTGVALAPVAAAAKPSTAVQPDPEVLVADFDGHSAAPDVHFLADWIAGSGDAHDRPFAVVDKRNARAYLFDAQARLRAESPVLLGAATGDDSVPGIGERPIAQVRPYERTTPAGRFLARPGRNTGGEDVIWVDYNAAVSMHRVRAANRAEHRLDRLATPTAADNRISYGCINVPAAFYEQYVRPMLSLSGAIIYVLPEVRGITEVFGAQVIASRQRNEPAKPAAPGA
jgi:hypothetical protein